MGGRDVVNQLLNQNGLAYTGAAEQTDLAALGIGADQIDDFDAGFQNFCGRLLLLIGGSRTVDGPLFGGFHRPGLVDGLSQQVKDTAETGFTHGNADGPARIDCLDATLQAVRGGHGNAANHVVADMLGDFRDDGGIAVFDFDGGQQLWQAVVRKTNVQNRTHNLDHGSDMIGHWIQLLCCE